MTFEEKYLDVLQNIEFPIQVVYKQHPDLTDYDALSAIESLIEFYIAEQRKREARKFNMSVKTLQVYDEVKEICDIRLGREKLDSALNVSIPKPLSVQEILECLKKIKNSIKKWTKRNGRQGYLNLVKGYMPYV
ncbi:MAG: hypothetical protein KJ799_09060 [Bacteroidetes bacterium]|nr:hypothetical protein [Bacteroidota bacterium]MBU1679239.1 hypothetical protein [Bacteroidota bacterium]MBU2506860.1 hypothetical protein [Bacteroidota bacterium]